MTMKIETKLVMQTSSEDESTTIKQIVPNSSRPKIISSKRYRSTYGAGVEEEDPLALPVLSGAAMSLMKRLLMLGKKSSFGKKSSAAVVSSEKPVVRENAPQKPDHPSPVQDRKRRGFGGLLSRLSVHAGRWDGKDLDDSAMLWNEAITCVAHTVEEE